MMLNSVKLLTSRQIVLRIGRILLAFVISVGLFTSYIPVAHAATLNAGTISGVVQDEHGNGIKGVVVYANDFDTDAPGVSAVTVSGGLYSLAVPDGQYRVRACPGCSNPVMPYANQYASADGGTSYWNAALDITIDPVNVAKVQNFTLQPGGNISGQVKNKAGTPVANLTIAVVNENNEWIDSGSTGRDGRYSIQGLPAAGTSYVLACADCNGPSTYVNMYYGSPKNVYFLDDATPVAISVGQTTANLNFVMDSGNTIQGVVTDTAASPHALSGIQVFAFRWGIDGWFKNVDTLPDGSYSLTGLPDGEYRIQVCPECSGRYFLPRFYPNTPNYDEATPLTVQNKQTASKVNFTLDPAAAISGKVTDRNTGEPLANISVKAESTQNYAGSSAVTDETGQYTILVKPGYYWLTTWNPDQNPSFYVDEFYGPASFFEEANVVDARVNQTHSGCDFQLEKGGALTGVVKGDDGKPLADASVMAVARDDPSSRSYASQNTGPDGVFNITGLPVGSYVLRATHPGSQPRFNNNQTDWNAADLVAVTAEQTTSGIEFQLPVETAEYNEDDTVREATNLPSWYDPSSSGFVEMANIIDQIFAGLTRIDPATGKTINNLVSSWETTDSRVWTFTLRDGLKWSDGSPLTAYDLRFGLLRGLREDKEQNFLYNLFVIEGAEAYNQGTTDASTVGISVSDATHIAFTLTQPVSFFPTLLSTLPARPLPQKLIQAYPGSWLNPDKLITSGPYKIMEYNTDQALLEKNTQFVDQANVKIQHVLILNASPDTAWEMYINHQLDTTTIPPIKVANVRNDPALNAGFVEVNQQCTNFLGFNIDALPASAQPSNPTLLRKALIEAVDRDGFVANSPRSAITAWTFIPPGVLGHSEQNANIHTPYDPAQANADMAAAYGGSPRALPQITLYYINDVGIPAMAEKEMTYLADTWNLAFNANFIVAGIPSTEYFDQLGAGKYPVWKTGWCSDYDDGYNFLSAMLKMDTYFGNWDTNAFRDQLEEAESTLNDDERILLYQDIEKKLLKDDALIMPYSYSIAPMVSRGFVRSYGVGGVNYTADWDFSRSDTTTLGSSQTAEALAQTDAGVTFTPAGERGSVIYTIPNGVFPAGTTLTHTGHLIYNLTGLPAGDYKAALYFTFQAENASHAAVNPAADYSLAVQYSQTEINVNNLLESSLALYYWDTAHKQWVKDPNSVVNPSANTISTHSKFLGGWLVLGVQLKQHVYISYVGR